LIRRTPEKIDVAMEFSRCARAMPAVRKKPARDRSFKAQQRTRQLTSRST
jgi:hypothetical protein